MEILNHGPDSLKVRFVRIIPKIALLEYFLVLKLSLTHLSSMLIATSLCCLEKLNFLFFFFFFFPIANLSLQVFSFGSSASGTNPSSQAWQPSLAIVIALHFFFSASARFNHSPEQRWKLNLPPAHMNLVNTGVIGGRKWKRLQIPLRLIP